MTHQDGFAFTEVLIALFLVASVLLNLLLYQWQTSQQLNQVLMRSTALTWLDNNSERIAASLGLTELVPPFYYRRIDGYQRFSIEVTWPGLSSQNLIKRQFFSL